MVIEDPINQPSTKQKLNVLIVEDNVGHAALISRSFEDDSRYWSIQTVGTINAAKILLDKQQPDLMILDYLLPDGEGTELLPGSLENRKFPIIIMTACGDENIAVHAMKAGALNYFIKSDVNFESLPHLSESALREWKHIENRREAEANLFESERVLSTLLGNMPGMAYSCRNDESWSMQYVSSGVYELTGYHENDLINNCTISYSQLIHEDDREWVWSHVQSALNNKEPFHLTYRILNSKGNVVWVQERGCGIFSPTGVLISLEGFISDITDLKNAELDVQHKSQESKAALLGVISAVANAVEARDPYTAGHQERVSDISVAIAERLCLESFRVEGIALGAKIHDIGKLALPIEILVKPSRLTALEFEMIKTHPEAAKSIIGNIHFPWPILEIAMQHHERINGTGYPHGLKGDEICLDARIVAVADVFEAMSSHRPYRPSLGIDKAMEELKANRGVFYDLDVVNALLDILDEDKDRFTV